MRDHAEWTQRNEEDKTAHAVSQCGTSGKSELSSSVLDQLFSDGSPDESADVDRLHSEGDEWAAEDKDVALFAAQRGCVSPNSCAQGGGLTLEDMARVKAVAGAEAVQAVWDGERRENGGKGWKEKEDGSVASNKSRYLEELEEQMRNNAERKRKEAEAERLLEEKLAEERKATARWGGGGEPLRNQDGTPRADLRGEVTWTEKKIPPGGRRSVSPCPDQAAASHSRAPLDFITPPRMPPQVQAWAEARSSRGSDSNSGFPQQKGHDGGQHDMGAVVAIMQGDQELKSEIVRLTTQLDLVLKAFQMEREKSQQLAQQLQQLGATKGAGA